MSAAKATRRKPPSSTPPAAAARVHIWWRVALILAAGIVVYWNSLGNPFVFDDHSTLVDNPHIRSFLTFWTTDKGSALTGRPVVSLTFAMDYALDGLNVAGYRMVNIGLHILCGLLLFGVVRRTLDGPRLRDQWGGETAAAIALAVALLWTVHPLNTEVVDYLTQRTEALMGVFFVLTMYASVRSLGGSRRASWQGLAVASSAIGMLCKEPMAAAPLIVVLYDGVFGFDSPAQAFRARWRFYAGLAATWIVVVISVATASRELSGGYATTHVSAWSYLLNQTVVITRYLELVVWPKRLVAYYGWSLPATLGAVWPYAVLVTAFVVASIAALVRWPRAGFLAVFFFVTLAPTSSFLPVAAEVGADRRMYVPLMGLVALAVIAARAPILRLGRGAAMACVVIATVGLGARTIDRNRDYSSELRLSQTTLDAWPSAVAHDMVGLSLAALGQRQEAARELQQAVADYAPARYDLGVQLFSLGRIDEAISELQRFIALEPVMFTASAARTLLGRSLVAKNRTAEAMDAYRSAVAGPMPDLQAHGFLADLLLDAGKYDEAIAHYRAYLEAYPDRSAALANLGIALASSKRTDEAIVAFRRAVDLEPRNAVARENLARMLIEAGQMQAAATEAQQAVALQPGSPTAHDLLGQAFVGLRRVDDARREFGEAVRLDPAFAEARMHLQRVSR